MLFFLCRRVARSSSSAIPGRPRIEKNPFPPFASGRLLADHPDIRQQALWVIISPPFPFFRKRKLWSSQGLYYRGLCVSCFTCLRWPAYLLSSVPHARIDLSCTLGGKIPLSPVLWFFPLSRWEWQVVFSRFPNPGSSRYRRLASVARFPGRGH